VNSVWEAIKIFLDLLIVYCPVSNEIISRTRNICKCVIHCDGNTDLAFSRVRCYFIGWWRMHICIRTYIFPNVVQYRRSIQFRIHLWLSSVLKTVALLTSDSYVWTLRISRKIFKTVVDDDKLDTTPLSLIPTLASCPMRVKIIEELRYAPSGFQQCGLVKKSIFRGSKISRVSYSWRGFGKFKCS
jgi:hypothetical protein